MNKLSKKNFLFLIFSLLLFSSLTLFFNQSNVYATNAPALALKPIYPNNQIMKNGIFFVDTKPGDVQDLDLSLINLSNEKQDMIVYPTTAYTTNGGAISFDNTKRFPKDHSLKYKFSDLSIKKKYRVTLQPNKATTVKVQVRIPKKHYEGIILGSLYVKPKLDEAYYKQNGASITNKFAVAMPVYLRDRNIKVVPKLTLGKVGFKQQNRNGIIYSHLYNEQPTTSTNMTMSNKIYRKGDSSHILSSAKETGMSLAPNSNFTYDNYVNSNLMIPGTYHIHIDAKDGNNNHWKIDKDFNVSFEQALEYNAKKIWWWLIIIIILLILILLLVYIIYRQHKKHKTLEDKD
ncbi:DUF3324 domain-containing protein [Apilactobacillus micheneri]|uniref:DUF3324 domain-containing protein n=1 Tax=Apilactobacillus micheneri TaxID=1899430 RepID=UPI000D029B2F|nr:DUF3324 domain-containing protein [Apilactobacillus micheneri]TPR37879.1 DUF3324 domain-containing protein [Apilactobacillus micheneri]